MRKRELQKIKNGQATTEKLNNRENTVQDKNRTEKPKRNSCESLETKKQKTNRKTSNRKQKENQRKDKTKQKKKNKKKDD